jgi:hypothetical protein
MTADRLVLRPSVTEDVHKLYAESFAARSIRNTFSQEAAAPVTRIQSGIRFVAGCAGSSEQLSGVRQSRATRRATAFRARTAL